MYFVFAALTAAFVPAILAFYFCLPPSFVYRSGCVVVVIGIALAAWRTIRSPHLTLGKKKLEWGEQIGPASIESFYDRSGNHNRLWNSDFKRLQLEFGLVFSGTLVWGFGDLFKVSSC